jgi:hypothetical protein
MTKHSIMRLDHRGEGPVALWDPDNKIEIKTAEEVFKGELARGANLHDLAKAHRIDSIMKTFDPDVEEILSIPQVEGG